MTKNFDIKYEFYIGMLDKDTHQREISERQAVQIIERILIDEVYTITDGAGKYRHEADGYVVSEPTKIVTIFDNRARFNEMRCYAKRLANALNQEAVFLNMSVCDAELIFNSNHKGA